MKKISTLIALACALIMTGCAGGVKTGKPARYGLSGPRQEKQKKSIAEQSAKTKAAMSAYPTKSTPVAGDTFLISDSEAANATKKATLSSTRAAIGLGTSDNPSFNSVHASGGNLAAANAQVTKKWITGLPYIANVTSVIYGGKHYICTSTHTADSTTEPGVGANWATVWSEVAGGSGATAIDDLTDVDTTGKATGKILKFDASGNLVVGDDSTGSGSVPSGTVNGQVLLWATDQWVASTPPWLRKDALGTGVEAALGYGVDAAGGLASYSSIREAIFSTGFSVANDTPSLGKDTISIDADTIPTSGSAKPITSGGAYTALAGKEPADPTIIKVAEVDSQSKFETLLGWTLPSGGGVGGYVTAPVYSDSTCTAGTYSFHAVHGVVYCKDTNTWDYQVVSGSSLAWASWNYLTPVDTTPDAFTFADVTNAALSTEYTELAQINGIAAGITCSGSGGTVAACTGSTVGTCGTFGATSGSITNGQYVGAKVTSSDTADTTISNTVTCGGVVSDPPFIVTTASASSCSTQSLIYDYSTQNYNEGNLYGTFISAFEVTGTGKRLYSVGFKTGTAANGSATTGLYKVLVSTNQNFSGTLVDEFYINTPGAVSTAFSALSSNRPILANGTTYYVGIYANGAAYSQLVNLGQMTVSGKTAYKIPSIGGTPATTSNRTDIGEVKVCDN